VKLEKKLQYVIKERDTYQKCAEALELEPEQTVPEHEIENVSPFILIHSRFVKNITYRKIRWINSFKKRQN
jgi:hypothetical protein